MVPPDSKIASLADLKGKKLGVAGGPIDKSWLLIQGLATKRHDMDLAAEVEPVYGAPPLLNETATSGDLDAVLNYWHFSARLEAQGFKELVGVEDAIAELGVASVPPQIGYVFRESFGTDHPGLIEAFAAASRDAKQLMLTDAEWERIRPLTKAEDDATFEALKRRYQDGIAEHWGEAERADAAKLYAILAELGGEKLVGEAKELAPGTFWPTRGLLGPWRAPAKPARSSGGSRPPRRSRRRRRCGSRPAPGAAAGALDRGADARLAARGALRRQPAPPAVAGRGAGRDGRARAPAASCSITSASRSPGSRPASCWRWRSAPHSASRWAARCRSTASATPGSCSS